MRDAKRRVQDIDKRTGGYDATVSPNMARARAIARYRAEQAKTLAEGQRWTLVLGRLHDIARKANR